MGFVSDLVGGSNDSEYAELTDSDLVNPSTGAVEIGFVNVKSQNDLVNAKESINAGYVVLLDISYIESNGLSLEVVYSELKSAVDSVGGDIVHKKRNDLIVATPRDITVHRDELQG